MDQQAFKVLYAEDEPDIQMIARIALSDIGGMELCICNNGREAIDNILEFNPDMIILDVMMPVMDGPAALSEIRKIPGHANTPAIFMTAKSQRQEVESYLALGAIDVITKPFNPMTLASQIIEIHARSQR